MSQKKRDLVRTKMVRKSPKRRKSKLMPSWAISQARYHFISFPFKAIFHDLTYGQDGKPADDQFLIKFQGESYLHVKWLNTAEVEEYPAGKQRIKRYLAKRKQMEENGELDEDGNTNLLLIINTDLITKILCRGVLRSELRHNRTNYCRRLFL